MAENSVIAWCDHTFNPWLGCSKVSPGCANCYAEHIMGSRFGRVKWGPHGTRSKTSVANWKEPMTWDCAASAAGTRVRVFCASLADVFEAWDGPVLDSKGRVLWRCECGYSTVEELDDCPRCGDGCAGLTLDDLRRDLFRLIDATPHLDWLLLTKRPENARRMWLTPINAHSYGSPEQRARSIMLTRNRWRHLSRDAEKEFRDNVWLGTSIESQDQAGRWKHLAECSDLAPVLWVSAEPLLGPLDVASLVHDGRRPDWIVFGGESHQGAPARPCDITWIRDGVRQCRELGIVPFVKQLGSHPVRGEGGHDWDHRLRDRSGSDPDEWPEDLRVREFPEVSRAAN